MMSILKENFLRFPIHRQIQGGVLSVTFCVCILVFLLLIINSFILINLTYLDLIYLVETKENQMLDQMAFYGDSTIFLLADTTKTLIQGLRNFFSNNRRRKEFINMLINFMPSDYLFNADGGGPNRNCLEGKSDCIEYRMMDSNIFSNDSFAFELKILALAIPLFRSIFNDRLPKLQNMSLFKSIQMVSVQYQTVFIFPVTANATFDPEYKFVNFTRSIDSTAKYFGQSYFDRTVALNNIDNISDIDQTITNNPFFYHDALDMPFRMDYPVKINNTIGTTSTISLLFDKNKIKNLSDPLQKRTIYNYSNIIDYIKVDWMDELIDVYTMSVTSPIKGVKILITDTYGDGTKKNNLLSPSNCHFLHKLFNLYSNFTVSYNSSEHAAERLTDCFDEENAKDIVARSFGFKNTSSFKRKKQFTVANTSDLVDMNRELRYKMYELYSPHTSTRVILESGFLSNFQVWEYVMKNQNSKEIYLTKIYYIFFGTMFMIMLFNCLIWVIIITYIVIRLHYTSTSISKPFSELLEQITSIGGEKNEDSPTKSKQIVYKDDQEINDLFCICNSLIKGGFNEERKAKAKHIVNAYNNITIVKSNNMIIKEDFIEDQLHEKKSEIFNYVGKDVIGNETITHNRLPDESIEDIILPNESVCINFNNEDGNKQLQRIDDWMKTEDCYCKEGSDTRRSNKVVIFEEEIFKLIQNEKIEIDRVEYPEKYELYELCKEMACGEKEMKLLKDNA